ncbi:M12 family metallo-peptidase [Corynebacterium mastitidis]|uniref:M12 family metallo-peptidase n=1 Tax=Corynebacterium mastitidis TaxID=161890 RepID=A0ABU8NZQ9_9CORY
MKKFLVKTMAAVLAVSVVAPGVAHADRWTKINPAQCKAAFAAVEAGQGLPDPQLLRLDKNNAMVGDTLEVYIGKTGHTDAIDAAIDAWTEASHGAIKIVKVAQPTQHSVEIADGYTAAVGEMVWKPKPHIVLNPKYMHSPLQTRTYVLAHEMGHAMGLGHGCADTLMRAGSSPGASSMTPTAVDVAAVRQGRF